MSTESSAACLLEVIQLANSNEESSMQARTAIRAKLGNAVLSDARAVIECDRCDTPFSVYGLDGAVFTKGVSKCDRRVGEASLEMGDWQLNIKLEKVTPSE